MKSISFLFLLGVVIFFNPSAHAQRGGDTRGSGDSKGSSDSRGSSETRSSSGGSDSGGSSSSGGSSGSDSGGSSGSSSCCDTYNGGGGGGGSSHTPRIKVSDFRIGQKVELLSTGDKGVITYIRKSLLKNYVCIEFDVDHTEECGFKANMIRGI